MSDQLTRFTLETADVRGAFVSLRASWRQVQKRHGYPPVVREQLGQSLAAVVLMSTTIKFTGTVILQITGDGPLHTLVAQATDRREIRGLARYRENIAPAPLAELIGDATMALTIDNNGERYQGIVPLNRPRLDQALEDYFQQSEQLPTRLFLAADGERVAGLLLQVLPGKHTGEEDWQRISLLADTLTDPELISLEALVLLHRLFNEERVRVFDPEPVSFRCDCSRERIATLLRAMGMVEIKSVLAEQGEVAVDCEFCNRKVRFDAVDVEQLFAAESAIPAPAARH